MDYARTDAHFLPYIARCLQQELLQAKHSNGKNAPVTLALQRSANVSRHLYEKPTSEVKCLTILLSLPLHLTSVACTCNFYTSAKLHHINILEVQKGHLQQQEGRNIPHPPQLTRLNGWKSVCSSLAGQAMMYLLAVGWLLAHTSHDT